MLRVYNNLVSERTSRGLIVREKKPQFFTKRKSEKRERSKNKRKSDRSMAAESNFVQPAIPKFNGHYDHWSMLMENFLRSKEYWSLVEDGGWNLYCSRRSGAY